MQSRNAGIVVYRQTSHGSEVMDTTTAHVISIHQCHHTQMINSRTEAMRGEGDSIINVKINVQYVVTRKMVATVKTLIADLEIQRIEVEVVEIRDSGERITKAGTINDEVVIIIEETTTIEMIEMVATIMAEMIEMKILTLMNIRRTAKRTRKGIEIIMTARTKEGMNTGMIGRMIKKLSVGMMRKLEKEKKNTRVNERITRMREGMKVEVREGMNIGEMKGRMIIEVENVETSMLRIGRRTRGMIETTGDRRTIRKIQRTMARKMKQKRSGGKLIRRKTLRGMINVTIGKEEMEEMGETEGTVEIETIEEEMDPREMATERMNQEMKRVKREEITTGTTTGREMINVGMEEGMEIDKNGMVVAADISSKRARM